MADRLWAKSWNESEDGPPPKYVYLPRHLSEVLTAADQVLAATAEDQLRAFGLNPAGWIDRFRRVVRLAAALHDLGKANDHFQGMVTKNRIRTGKPQGLRHEWVTWLIVQRDDFRNWLSPALGPDNCDANWTAMLWAVTGHHPAFRRPSPPTEIPNGGGSEMLLQVGHADFRKCVNWLANTFDLDQAAIPHLNDTTIELSDALRTIHREMVVNSARIWAQWKDKRRTPGMSAFVAAVKNCLVAADVAGSALPEDIGDDHKRQTWIAASFHRVPEKTDFDAIISDRLTDGVTGQIRELRLFQQDVAKLGIARQ